MKMYTVSLNIDSEYSEEQLSKYLTTILNKMLYIKKAEITDIELHCEI